MATSWVGPAYLDGMKTALDADVTLGALTPAINVYTVWPNPDVSESDAIILWRVRDNQEHAWLGTEDGRISVITIDGQILVARPLEPGTTTEAVAKTARDRVTTMLDVVTGIVNDRLPAVGTQVRRSIIENIDFTQYPSVMGDANVGVRVARVTFEITAQIRVD